MNTPTQASSIAHTVALMERGAYGDAQALLEAWLHSNSGDTYGHFLYVRCFFQIKADNERSDSLYAFHESLRVPDHRGGLREFLKAEELFSLSEYRRAVPLYEQSTAAGLMHPIVYHRCGEAMAKDSDTNGAVAKFEAALRRDKGFAPAVLALAELLFEEGCFHRLGRQLKQSLGELDAENCKLFEGGSDILTRLNAIDMALSAIREACELDHQGRANDAVRRLWPISRYYTTNLAVLRSLMSFFYRSGRLDIGMRRITELLPRKSAWLQYAEGLGAWYVDQLEEAASAYEECMARNMTAPLVRFARALVLMSLGRSDDARRDLMIVHEVMPWLAGARAELALAAFEVGDYDTVCKLGDVSTEERGEAVLYEPSGRNYIGNLDAYVMRAQLELGIDPQDRRDLADDPTECRSMMLRYACGVYEAGHGSAEEAEELLIPIVESGAIDEIRVTERESLVLSELGRVAPISPWIWAALETLQRPASGGDSLVERSKDVVENGPDDGRFVMWLARRAMQEGRMEIASFACKRLRDRWGDLEDTLDAQCELHSRLRDIKELRIAATANPSSVVPLMYLHNLGIDAKDDELVKESDAAIARVRPGLVKVYAAVKLYREGAVSIDTLARVVREGDPYDFEGRSLGAFVMFQGGLYGESREVHQKLCEEGYDEIAWILDYALNCLATGKEGCDVRRDEG